MRSDTPPPGDRDDDPTTGTHRPSESGIVDDVARLAVTDDIVRSAVTEDVVSSMLARRQFLRGALALGAINSVRPPGSPPDRPLIFHDTVREWLGGKSLTAHLVVVVTVVDSCTGEPIEDATFHPVWELEESGSGARQIHHVPNSDVVGSGGSYALVLDSNTKHSGGDVLVPGTVRGTVFACGKRVRVGTGLIRGNVSVSRLLDAMSGRPSGVLDVVKTALEIALGASVPSLLSTDLHMWYAVMTVAVDCCDDERGGDGDGPEPPGGGDGTGGGGNGPNSSSGGAGSGGDGSGSDGDGTTSGSGDQGTGGESTPPVPDAELEQLRSKVADLEACRARCEQLRDGIDRLREELADNRAEQRELTDRIADKRAQLAALKRDAKLWVYYNTASNEVVTHAGRQFTPASPLEYKGWVIPAAKAGEVADLEAGIADLEQQLKNKQVEADELQKRIDELTRQHQDCLDECAARATTLDDLANEIRDAAGTDPPGRIGDALGAAEDVLGGFLPELPADLPPVPWMFDSFPRLDRAIGLDEGLNWDVLGFTPAGFVFRSYDHVNEWARTHRGGYFFSDLSVEPSYPTRPSGVYELFGRFVARSNPGTFDSIAAGRSPRFELTRPLPPLLDRERVNLYVTFADGHREVVGIVLDDREGVLHPGGVSNPTKEVTIDHLTLLSALYGTDPVATIADARADGRLTVEGVGLWNWCELAVLTAIERLTHLL